MTKEAEVYNIILNHAIGTGGCRQIIEAPFKDMVDEIVKLFAIPDVSGSLPTENTLNFLHWMYNWGHLSIEVKEKDFTEFIRQYNSCSEHIHNLGNDR